MSSEGRLASEEKGPLPRPGTWRAQDVHERLESGDLQADVTESVEELGDVDLHLVIVTLLRERTLALLGLRELIPQGVTQAEGRELDYGSFRFLGRSLRYRAQEVEKLEYSLGQAIGALRARREAEARPEGEDRQPQRSSQTV